MVVPGNKAMSMYLLTHDKPADLYSGCRIPKSTGHSSQGQYTWPEMLVAVGNSMLWYVYMTCKPQHC